MPIYRCEPEKKKSEVFPETYATLYRNINNSVYIDFSFKILSSNNTVVSEMIQIAFSKKGN